MHLDHPPDETSLTSAEKPSSWPRRQPFHSSFGPRSAVQVHLPWRDKEGELDQEDSGLARSDKKAPSMVGVGESTTTRPKRTRQPTVAPLPSKEITRRPVGQRWFYEPITSSVSLLITWGDEEDKRKIQQGSGSDSSPQTAIQPLGERNGESCSQDQQGRKTDGTKKDDVAEENKNVFKGFSSDSSFFPQSFI